MVNTPPSVGPSFIYPGAMVGGSGESIDFSSGYGPKGWLLGGAAGRRPTFRITYSGNMGFGNGTFEGRVTNATGSWTVQEDTDAGWDNQQLNPQYIVQTAGHWIFEVHANWSNTGGYGRVGINARRNWGASNWSGPGITRTQASNYCYAGVGTQVWPIFSATGGSPNRVVTSVTFSGVLIGLA